MKRKGSGYLLDVEPGDVDAVRLEVLVRDGRAASSDGDWSAATENFAPALDLHHRDPFRDLADFRFARAAATRIEELVLAAIEGLADCRLNLGQHADAIGPLIDAVREHPYRERFHAQLMLALYRCGRQAEAMRAYKAARDVLVEDLGLEPGSELQALQKAMLEHDQSLIGARSSVPPLPGAVALPGPRTSPRGEPTSAVTTTDRLGCRSSDVPTNSSPSTRRSPICWTDRVAPCCSKVNLASARPVSPKSSRAVRQAGASRSSGAGVTTGAVPLRSGTGHRSCTDYLIASIRTSFAMLSVQMHRTSLRSHRRSRIFSTISNRPLHAISSRTVPDLPGGDRNAPPAVVEATHRCRYR